MTLVEQALGDGGDPRHILNDGLVPGIQALSRAFRDGQAYLPEILLARAMNRCVDLLAPYIPRSEIPAWVRP